MKISYILAVVALMLMAGSCDGNRKDSGSNVNAASRQELVGDSIKNVSAVDSVSPETAKDPAVPVQSLAKDANAAKASVKPETAADRLVKQYGETLVALIQASKAGKPDEAAAKKFDELKRQLEELDKRGKLSTNQKELFKATNDAFEKLNK